MLTKYKLTDQEKNINYKIVCPTPTNYKLNLTFHSKTDLMKLLFQKSKKALRRKKGIEIKEDDIEGVKNFVVPTQYYKFLKVAIKGAFNNVSKEFLADGVKLLNYDIDKVFFIFNETTKLWDIQFKIKGIYTKDG